METQGKPWKPKENKEKPWKPNETQGKQGETMETQGKQGDPLQSTKEILSDQWDSFLSGGNTLPLSGNAKRLRVMVGIVLLVVDIVCPPVWS